MDNFLSFAGAFFLVILLVLLFLLFILVLICISHPKIIVRYREKPEISASLWFIKFNITGFLSRPKKKKKPKIIHFDGKLFGELPPETGKKKKKRADHNISAKAASPEKKEKKPITETVSQALELTGDILSDISEPIKKVLTVDIKRLYVTAASDNPHGTALLFGSLNTAIGTLILVCKKFAALDIDTENVGVYSDFCSTKPSLDAHIVLTLSARHIILCGFKAVMRFIKNKT